MVSLAFHGFHYTPFGMLMEDTTNWRQDTSYRFGFNGMENDNSVNGHGVAVNFGSRIYNSRLGQWLSVDPQWKKYVSQSPYHFTGGNPILFIDIDGEKYVNPYVELLKSAEGKLKISKDKYSELVSNHKGKLRKRHKRKYARKSGMKSDLRNVARLEQKKELVDDILYTYSLVHPEDYDYFNTLKTPEGKDVEIEVYLMSGNNERSDRAETLDLEPKLTQRPDTENPGENGRNVKKLTYDEDAYIRVNLYPGGQNLGSFANEMGDLKYLFQTVKSTEDLKRFIATSGGDPSRYREEGGSGQYSFDYEELIENLFKEYVKNNKIPIERKEGEDGPVQDPVTQTIKKD